MDYYVKQYGPHKYGCVLLPLPPAVAKIITDFSAKIPDGVIGEGGRETDAHITLKYGLKEDSPQTLGAVRGILAGFGLIPVRFGVMSLFRGGKDGDVLKLDIDSPALHRLNAEITAAVPCFDKFPEYQPHATVAYLDPAIAEQYVGPLAGLTGITVNLEQVEYCTAVGERTMIRLGFFGGKAMSTIDVTTGGALVPPPQQGRKRIKPKRLGRSKTLLALGKGWKSGDSYFAECPRDDEGHCKPSGQGDDFGASGKKPTSFRSNAEVVYGSDDPTIVMGKMKLADEDVASLVGAPDNAKVKISGGEDHLIVRVDHPQYTQLRYISIEKNGLSIINQEFFLKKGVETGSGLGSKVFADQVSSARAFGIKRIDTTASSGETGDGSPVNGFYTWPRFGYDAPIANIESSDIKRMVKETFPAAQRISDLMKTKEGRDWWKKNGGDIQVSFDLSDGSLSMSVFNAYLEERKKKGGQDAG